MTRVSRGSIRPLVGGGGEGGGRLAPDFWGAARGDAGWWGGALGLVRRFVADGEPVEEGAGGRRGVKAARCCPPGRPRYGGGGGLVLWELAPSRRRCDMHGGGWVAARRDGVGRGGVSWRVVVAVAVDPPVRRSWDRGGRPFEGRRIHCY